MPPRLKVPLTDDGLSLGTLFFPDGRTIQGIWSRPNVPALVFADSGYSGGTGTFHGGPIATGVPIQLIFWGTFWQSGEGDARLQMITDRTRRIIESTYFSGLAQYGINPPSYRGAFIVTDPDAPATFDDRMEPVLDLIDDLIDDDRLPDPDDGRIVFLVFMPKSFSPSVSANGAHSSDYDYDFPFDTDMYWAGWVRYFDPSLMGPDQDPESTSRTASHELIETLTDPEANGWYIGGSPSTGEFADGAVSSGGVRQTAFVNGAKVSSYWSNAHNATIIPIDQDYAARIVGTVDVESQYQIASGAFRPEPNARLCAKQSACCFADREYSWTVTGQDEVATLTLERQRYLTPNATWTVAGQPAVGSGSLSVAVNGTDYNGRKARKVSKTVTVDFVATPTTLTLRTNRSELNFDLDVACSVHDDSITGNLSVDILATPAITIGFVGETLDLDPSYNEQMENCLKALTAEYTQKKGPQKRPPHGPGGAIEIDQSILAQLPAWLRVSLYDKNTQTAELLRISQEVLPTDAAQELRTSLLGYTPELALALEQGGLKKT